jgi:parallel beta-helix repeat protein
MRTRTLIAGGCVAAFLFAAQPASAVVVLRVVDDDGQATPFDCNAGAAASAHTTITAAVTASSAGDFIKVCPGTYNEQVTVNKALTLLGAQAGVDARGRSGAAGTESIVRGAGTPRTTPFNVTASNVTIDGFTVQDQTDTANLGFGIFLTAGLAGEIVRNNIVQNNIAGLALGSDNTTIQHNVFRNNNQPGPISGTGVYTDQFQAGGTLSNVTIAANEFSGNQNVGVLLGSTTGSGRRASSPAPARRSATRSPRPRPRGSPSPASCPAGSREASAGASRVATAPAGAASCSSGCAAASLTRAPRARTRSGSRGAWAAGRSGPAATG